MSLRKSIYNAGRSDKNNETVWSMRYQSKETACMLILLSISLICAAPLRQAPYRTPILTGHLVNPSIEEASGMVASHQNKGIFWIHNDSGHGPYLFAVTGSGEHVGRFQIAANGVGLK